MVIQERENVLYKSKQQHQQWGEQERERERAIERESPKAALAGPSGKGDNEGCGVILGALEFGGKGGAHGGLGGCWRRHERIEDICRGRALKQPITMR